MNIFDVFYSVVAPDRCLKCGYLGSLLCGGCVEQLPMYAPRCYRCERLSSGHLTCQSCTKRSRLDAVFVAGAYDGIVLDVIQRLKFDASRGACTVGAELILQVLPFLDPNNTIITHAPTTPQHIRERSFDQSEKIARNIARQLGINYMACLRRVSLAHQTGAAKKERLLNKNNMFEKRAVDLKGKTVVIVDDVITTGATLEAAAQALSKLRPARIVGAVIARPVMN